MPRRTLLIRVGIVAALCGMALGRGVCRTASAAGTQTELATGACAELDQAATEMELTGRQVRLINRDDQEFLKKFDAAQQAWRVYRDAHLAALYPERPEAYGSVIGMCRCNTLAEMTRERVKVLTRWLAGEEGDVCADSRRPR